MIIRRLGPSFSVLAYGQIEHDEAKGYFSQFCERA